MFSFCGYHLNFRDIILPLLSDNKNFFSKNATIPRTRSRWGDEDGGDVVAAIEEGEMTQPESISGTMKDYQVVGLKWLADLHKNGVNGILGDEMGLGKTLQTISLLAYLKESRSVSGPHLIVAPLSVLESWINEFKKWCPDLFSVLRFHGQEAVRKDLKKTVKSGQYDVVVTTYEMIVSESYFFKNECAWCYVVLDEGHKIKNDLSMISQELSRINSQYRLILTGTPLQNNLLELWCLFHYLFPDVFDDNSREKFKNGFKISENKYDIDLVNCSGRFLNLVMLRRMKSDANIHLDIPDKEEVTIYLPLTPVQKAMYKKLLTNIDDSAFQDLLQGFDKEGLFAAAMKSSNGSSFYQKMRGLLFNLRMTCSHPFLCLEQNIPGLTDEISQIVACSSKLVFLEKLLPVLKKKGHRVLIFCQYIYIMDILETYLYSKGYEYGRLDGSVGRARRELDIKMFNDKNSEMFVFLLSTRAGGLGLNLATADTVIFYDSDWNPQVDLQAMARAHRIGQTKKVTIYRLCLKDTVEERLLAISQRKLWLSAKITAHQKSPLNENDGINQMSASQIVDTIKFGSNCVFKASESFDNFLKEDVEVLLSRSKDNAQLTENTELSLEFFDNKENLTSNFSAREFEGKVYKPPKELDYGQRMLLEVGQSKRQRVERTLDIGGHAVLAQTIHSDEAVPSIVTLLKVAGEENKFKDAFDFRRMEKVSAPFQHEKKCHHCYEKVDLEHPSGFKCCKCPRVFHKKCIGRRQRDPKGGLCVEHKCVECFKTSSSSGGLILRCQHCANSYCLDHLPHDDKITFIGEQLKEFEKLNFHPQRQYYYIHCPDCKK